MGKKVYRITYKNEGKRKYKNVLGGKLASEVKKLKQDGCEIVKVGKAI